MNLDFSAISKSVGEIFKDDLVREFNRPMWPFPPFETDFEVDEELDTSEEPA